MLVSFSPLAMTLLTKAASWIFGFVKPVSLNTAQAQAQTSQTSAAQTNRLLVAACKSSGLMSFLRIGDRAAGAIKSGGTTRRAAKMVTVDIDHPDIVDYIDWKVVEEQKVAALVAGSKLASQHMNEVMAACCDESVAKDDRYSAKTNKPLKKAIINARKSMILKTISSA